MHRIAWDGELPAEGSLAEVAGTERDHAVRVKRARAGERVELLDGLGGVAAGRVEPITRAAPLTIRVESVRHLAETTPRLDVWAATPKGGRVDELVEGLSEAGAASWAPLLAERTVVEPRPGKLERLRRAAVESAKQCGRPWFLRIEAERRFEDALRTDETGPMVVLADASGEPYRAHTPAPGTIRLLIGPEGGWSEGELAAARNAGVLIARFGPHAMRVETAAVAAAAVILNAASA